MINTDTIRNGWAFASAIHTESASDRSTMSRIVVNGRFADNANDYNYSPFWGHILGMYEEAEYITGAYDGWTWEVRDLDTLLVLRTTAHFQPVVIGIDESGRLLGVEEGLSRLWIEDIVGQFAAGADAGEHHGITWSAHRVRNGQLIDADAFRAALIA
jgi:hypothetical protein